MERDLFSLWIDYGDYGYMLPLCYSILDKRRKFK